MVWSNSPVFVQLQSHPGVSVGASAMGVGEGEGGGLGDGLGDGLGVGDAFRFCSPVEEGVCHN